MITIGLTGSLGTGKSTVARMFARRGARVIDADRIVRRLLRGIRVDRKKLAEAVFADRKKLRKLERIIHPYVRRVIRDKLKQYRQGGRTRVAVLDVPLLFESGLHRETDMNIVVKAGKEQQIRRSMKRLGLSRSDAVRRIRAQMPLKQKIRKADFIIDNQRSRNATEKQVKQIWKDIQS